MAGNNDSYVVLSIKFEFQDKLLPVSPYPPTPPPPKKKKKKKKKS